MSENAGLNELWLRRHDDSNSIKAVKNEFTPAKIRATMGSKNQHIKGVYEDLYDRAIDFGGHPNERAVTSNLEIIDLGGSTKKNSIYMQKNGPELNHVLKTCAQTGVASLEIFQDVFPGRFELLGARQEIPCLRQGL